MGKVGVKVMRRQLKRADLSLCFKWTSTVMVNLEEEKLREQFLFVKLVGNNIRKTFLRYTSLISGNIRYN